MSGGSLAKSSTHRNQSASRSSSAIEIIDFWCPLSELLSTNGISKILWLNSGPVCKSIWEGPFYFASYTTHMFLVVLSARTTAWWGMQWIWLKLHNSLNDTLSQLISYDIVLSQDRSFFQSAQQSSKPVVAKLVIVWEGLMELLPWQWYLVSKADGIGKLVIHGFLWFTDAEKFKIPEQAQCIVYRFILSTCCR